MTVEEILLLCGKIFAALAIVFLFYDVIASIVKRKNIKLSVCALVFLSLAAILFSVAQFILKDGIVCVILSIVALVFLMVYLVCDVFMVVGNMKMSKRGKAETTTEEESGKESEKEE